jgi:Fe-S cluster assembly protein SufD
VHLREQDEAHDHLHHAALGVSVAEGARYQLTSVLLGGSTTRVEIDVRLAGEGASADLSGLAALRGSQHADHHVTIDHASPGCTSRQLFRSLLDDRAHGIFTGKVIVRRGAVKTDAVQHHRALLLSDDALAHARPQLEIDADDVKCAHGAAVGSLDEEALFYLRQRGLDPRQARALLTAAFAQDVLATIPFAEERARLEAHMTSWLEAS